MSKHWDPYLVPGGRQPRRRQPSLREIVLTALAGILAGLAVFGLMNLRDRIAADEEAGAGSAIASLRPSDPYAEARKSRAILDGQAGPPSISAERGQAASPAAVRVIDGDTFVYGGTRIRIADIDTPETQGRCAFETGLAARATSRMRALLAAGPFELHSIAGRDEDRYGRKLRIVTRGGRSLGDQLVAEGLARTWSGRREPWC
jgi:endonuclease YncB( thermonuclease family)